MTAAGRGEAAKRTPLSAARIAVLVALAVGVVAILVAVRGSDSSYRVSAVFSSVNGLVEGAPVRVAGLAVGSVETIDLGDDGLPHVELAIDSGYEVRDGAVADLRAGSASGQVNRFITLTPGDGDRLGDGDVLGLARTDEPVEVDRVLSTLDPKTRAGVHELLDGLARATDGRAPEIEETLAHSTAALGQTADLLAQVGADGEALRGAIDDGRVVVEELAGSRDALAGAAERTAGVLETTARRHADLATSLDRLPGALDAAGGALSRLDAEVPDLRDLVAAARPAVAELVPFSRALRPAIDSAEPALDEASRLVGGAGAQIDALDPLLGDAEPALEVLDPALSAAGPILDEARVRTPDFFSFFANWADFTGVYDANGHAARVGLVLPPAPSNLIDGSEPGAGHLEAPFVRTPGVLEGEPWMDYRESFLSGGQE